MSSAGADSLFAAALTVEIFHQAFEARDISGSGILGSNGTFHLIVFAISIAFTLLEEPHDGIFLVESSNIKRCLAILHDCRSFSTSTEQCAYNGGVTCSCGQA